MWQSIVCSERLARETKNNCPELCNRTTVGISAFCKGCEKSSKGDPEDGVTREW